MFERLVLSLWLNGHEVGIESIERECLKNCCYSFVMHVDGFLAKFSWAMNAAFEQYPSMARIRIACQILVRVFSELSLFVTTRFTSISVCHVLTTSSFSLDSV